MKYLFTIVFALSIFSARAQNNLIKDSLLKELSTRKDDTSKVRLLLNIEKLFTAKNYDSFYYYLQAADQLAKKIGSDKFDFFINAGYAEYYYNKNDYSNAVKFATLSKDIAEKENDLKLLAKSYNNLAAVYNHFGQYRSAVDCILKCLDISEKTKDSISLPVRNLTASNTYYNLKQYDKTILFAKKAVDLGAKLNNSYAVAMGLNNLAAGYADLNMTDSAIATSKTQLAFAKKEEDPTNINYALINLCFNNFQIGNFQEVEKYSSELATYSKTLPDDAVKPQVLNAFALNKMAHKQYDAAKNILDSAINVAIADSNADALGNLYRTYSTLSYLQNKIKEGWVYSYKYDSLNNAANLKELNFYTEDLEKKYETEKKDAQIKLQKAELKQKNFLNYGLIGGLAALLLISILGYRNYTHKQKLQQAKINELETERQLTATEAVLKGEEQERTRLAKDLHDGLGSMLSGIKFSFQNMKENLIMTPDNAQAFERGLDMLDGSIKEMRRVAHNMMPEMLVKYGLNTALKEFCDEVSRSSVINATYQPIGMDNASFSQITAVTVYRIVQELVNNAIKHANAKQVLVQAHLHDKLLSVTVEDDGKGFNTDTLKTSTGMGWNNIRNRVDLLNGRIDIHSGPGNGTSTMMEFDL